MRIVYYVTEDADLAMELLIKNAILVLHNMLKILKMHVIAPQECLKLGIHVK